MLNEGADQEMKKGMIQARIDLPILIRKQKGSSSAFAVEPSLP
ncbi:hypothetical protein JOC78_003245 [Bacillus ectoiniformans]|nr:hypothetical protein [Bacillus ectoiniformans]MBM7650260.1 hypothetical protein [Bacillus ectoiniformans]